MHNVAQWLEKLGLGQLADAFAQNDVDFRALPHLTEQDLKDLGLSLGHRRILLAAISELEQQRVAPLEQAYEPKGDAERRQLTVMFCDLVGSTALSERLDPEDLREVIHAYQECCAGVVARFGGFIARYMGDGLLIYFGYPQAHEDDAERAIRAGLGIVEAVGELRPRDDLTLQVRIGIATGLVVAGDMIGEGASEESAVLGETPNLASRLQGLAEPDTVVIAPATHHLVSGLFEHKDLGSHDLKGISTPVQAWRVVGETAAESRFDAAHAAGMTPLVGREEEINLLLKRWDRAKNGEGQVVLLSGEAGIGKSRILRGFRDRLQEMPHSRILYYASPYHRNSALHPVIDQLERGFRFERDDDPNRKLDKLEAVLADLSLPIAEHAPLLASLLSLPTADRYRAPVAGPEQLKKETLTAVIAIIEAMATRHPVLMVVEDLHWIDPSTLELLGLLTERLRSARILLVGIFRPEFEQPWGGQTHVTILTLNRLSRRESAAIIAEVVGGKSLPEEVLGQILTKTDGVPLFVEELTKTVVESGLLDEKTDRYVLSGELPPFAIPASLQDALMARLDRLGAVKEVAQLAATLGRTFTHELLAAVSPLDQDALADAMSQLLAAELLFRRDLPPDASYEFKHALVQDAAYGSLLKSKRQQLHRHIAEVLERQFPTIGEREPDLLAYHFTEAGLTEPAIGYWRRAGEQAQRRSMNQEAVNHLRNGLKLLEALPNPEARIEGELEFLTTLGPALMAIRGWSSPEVEETYDRARELCRQVGQSSQLFNVIWGQWMVTQARANHRMGQELGKQLLAAALPQQDESLILQAHHAVWATNLYVGELAVARDHMKRGDAIYDPELHGEHAHLYGGHDPGVCCKAMTAWALWLSGYPSKSLESCEGAIALSKQLSHAPSQAHAFMFAARQHAMRQEVDQARRFAEATIEIAEPHGLPVYRAIGNIVLGWGSVSAGKTEEGFAHLRRGLAEYRSIGAVLGWPLNLSLLADACARNERTQEALDFVAEALQIANDTGERMWEAELHRQRGDLLRRQNGTDQQTIESCYLDALEVARRQGARSLELRAAVRLAEFWREQDRNQEACNLLNPICAWFTEGFDTVEIKAANRLLAELS